MINRIYRNLIAGLKFLCFILFTLFSLILSIFTYNFKKPLHEKLIRFYCCTVCKIFRITVKDENFDKIPKRSSLYVSNHTSYVDIIALGSKIKVRFTPKIEISKWPLMNILVNLSLPVYIQRNAGKSLEQKDAIKKIINSGDSIIVFPEGTTNDGKVVLPFKSSLFSVAEDDKKEKKKIAVQPVSIIYTKIDGEEANEHNMDLIAWYGDMKFLPHFWSLMKAKGAEVKLIFHNLAHYDNFSSRKELAKHCEDLISESFKKERDMLNNKDISKS